MRKRRMLRNPFTLAAFALCGVLLPGCGDDGGGSPNNLDDIDVNQLPYCSIVAAFVDLATQQVVVQVNVGDPDQLSQAIGITVRIELIDSFGTTYANDILSASSGNLVIANQAFGVSYSNFAPGLLNTFRISSTAPNLLPSDQGSSVRVTVTDELGGTSTCTGGVDLSLLLSEPDCQILDPGAADVGVGIIPLSIQVSDNQGDTSALSIYWSLDGGTTLNPATLTSTSAGALGAPTNCNPANPYSGGGITGIPTALGGAATVVTANWDSAADGVGLAAVANVTLVVFAQDCTTVAIGGMFDAPCTATTGVLNNGAPVCSITAPAGGSSTGGTSEVTIDFTTTDADSPLVECTFEWSTNGGTTWNLATPGVGSTNPMTAAPGAGSFQWASPADIPVASLPVAVTIRKTNDDLTGRPVLTSCTTVDGMGATATFTLVPISEPSCAITSPAAGVCADAFPAGTISLAFNLTDSQGDPISFSVCFNTGGGNMPATLMSTSNGVLGAYVPTNPAACVGGTNQVTAAAAGATTVTWNVAADGLGAMTCDNVTVTIFPEDGTTLAAGPFFTCNQAFSVSDNGAPSCTVTAIGDASVTFSVTDADSAMVSALFEYSTNGGATFQSMTPSAGTNPRMVAPGAGLMFPWAGTTDIPVCTTGVIGRVTVDDGVGLPNRPATCSSAATDINCIPLLTACRAVEAVGTAFTTGTNGVNPPYTTANGGPGAAPTSGDIDDTNGSATGFWNFEYPRENTGPFNTTVTLTTAGGAPLGNPVVLMSAGHDYSGFANGAVCNAIDTFQVVLEGTIGATPANYAANMTAFMGATITTVWTSNDVTAVSVSADGLLTAVGENSCTTIDWTMMSSDPTIVTIDPSCASGSFAACVDSGGIDQASRAMFLPVGDIDANLWGMPSGRPVGSVGTNNTVTFVCNAGASGVGALAFKTNFSEVFLNEAAVDTMSIGASTQPQIASPVVVSTLVMGQTRWNDFDVAGTHSGIFDVYTQTFSTASAGTTTLMFTNEEFADASSCNIWVGTACMPFSVAPCMAPPPGGYLAIAATGDLTINP